MSARRPLRALIAAGAAVSLMALTLLPAEHVHGTRHDGDHHAPLVHRHVAPHHHDDTAPTVDHPDEDDVRWVSTVFVRGNDPGGAKADPASAFLPNIVTPLERAAGRPAAFGPSAHDPPDASSSGLRGPPSFRSDVI
jgi:hypothetical protein